MQKKDDPYLETREKEDAFVERIVSQVTEKILTNLPTLAGMYMMQQQAMLTAGLQNAGMPVMNFTADPTNANMMEAGAQKVTKSIKSGMAENQAATKKSEDILDEDANYAQTECQFRYCGTAIPFLTVRSTAR